jgi:GH15 family glucan-1,4-alpha-glucosidase
MAWVAFDRAIKSAETYKLPAPLEHWREVRAHIHADVCARGFDPELNSFVRAYDTKELDASLLLLPAIGFLPPHDPRILGTLAAVEQNLLRNGFVYRYDQRNSNDGLQGGEGVFLACSFWLADAYVMCGRRDEAVRLFERLLSLRNDVGLLSEEYEPNARRLVGNFPQAFSHLALVNTASNLAHSEKPAEQRSETKVSETA